MFFYGLPRFSTDLDFNLIDAAKEQVVYDKVKAILLKYGKIHDEAMKYYGPILVLDYGAGTRKLKVEISKRNFNDSYSMHNLLGIDMKVMDKPNMLSHKLCAILDRNELTNRDIFDTWYLMEQRTPVVRRIIEERMQRPLETYLEEIMEKINGLSNKGLLNGLGELMDEKTKNFVRTRLLQELVILIDFYKTFPITS